MTTGQFSAYERFYLAECDQFNETELVFDSDGTLSRDEALLHAIRFFTSEGHYKEIDAGDSIRISGPYPVGGGVSTVYPITQHHLDDEQNL